MDDLALAEIVKTNNHIIFTMQQSLDGFTIECKALLVISNPLKCEILISSNAKRPITYLELYIDGIYLHVVTDSKLLGDYINPLLHEALPGHKKICHLIHIILNRKNEYMIYFY